MVANIITVSFLCLLQLNVELAASKGLNTGLEDVAEVCGYLLVCLSEPLLMLSYGARFLRVRRIFDAQKIYFDNSVRPSEMIRQYSEPRLTMMVLGFVAVLTATYMAVGAIIWGAATNGYGVLPTFAIGFATQNTKAFVSLFLFCFSSLVEGAVLALSMDKIREIKREFSMLSELQVFSALWLTLTNLAIFFGVQGPLGGWFL